MLLAVEILEIVADLIEVFALLACVYLAGVGAYLFS